MGFYEFTLRGRKEFQQLESWLAEETLDELEALVSKPPARRRKAITGWIHDFVRIRDGVVYYVFLTIVSVSETHLRVTRVGQYVRHP